MTIQELLANYTETYGVPTQYGTMDEMCDPPFIVYMGYAPDHFYADNIPYVKQKAYRIEYYFKTKDESLEETLESTLSSDGWIFDRSDDLYISQEKLYAIYYYIERMQNYGN